MKDEYFNGEQISAIICTKCMNERKCYSYYPGGGKIEKYNGRIFCLACYSDELIKKLIKLLEEKKQ